MKVRRRIRPFCRGIAAQCRLLPCCCSEAASGGVRVHRHAPEGGLRLWFDDGSLRGLRTKPWDFDSACIAVMVGNGDSKAIAHSCRAMGAPIVWVRHNGTVDWWMQHAGQPTLFASKPVQEFRALVKEHKDKLDPVSVYRGKTIGAWISPGTRLC